MGLVVQEQWGGQIELIPEGVYPARCYAVVDFGTQAKKFKDQEKDVHEIGLYFEIPELSYEFEDKETGEKRKGTKQIGAIFSASLSSKANLRKFLDTWRGKKFTEDELKGFDLKKVVGAGCMLQIVHSEDGKWANIQSAMPPYKGITIEETTREKIFFELDFEKANKGEADFYDEVAFEKLPEYMQKKIMDSKEYRKAFGIETLEEQEANMKAEAKAPATLEEAQNVFWE